MESAGSPAAAWEGFFRYDQAVQEIVKADDSGETRLVSVTFVKGYGGAGNTTSFLSALRNPRAVKKYLDSSVATAIGQYTKEENSIKKNAGLTKSSNTLATMR